MNVPTGNFIPQPPIVSPVYVDDDDELSSSSDESDIQIPEIPGMDSSEDDEYSDDYNDSDEDADIKPHGGLMELMTLGKVTVPNFGAITPLPKAYVTPSTLPQVLPQVPRPGAITLNVRQPAVPVTQLPQFNLPQPNLPQLNLPRATIPMPPTNLPQATLTMPTLPQALPRATIPMPPTTLPQATLPQVGLVPRTTPQIPQLGGLKVNTPQLSTAPKAVDIEVLLAKMPGVNITGLTPAIGTTAVDVKDMLQKEADESDEDFTSRSTLTIQLASIPDYKINTAAAVTAGHLMMKKSRLGVKYDDDIEVALSYLIGLLQR